MTETENIGSFFNENKKLVKDYLETRLEIYRLILIRAFSRSAGYFIWFIVSMFLLFLVIIFLGLVTGFWLSEFTGSYTKGFGLATLVIAVIILILALLRKTIFVSPIIHTMINKSNEEIDSEK